MSIKAMIEVYRDPAKDEIDRDLAAQRALADVEELVEFARTFIAVHDAGLLDSAKFERLDRIRELVG